LDNQISLFSKNFINKTLSQCYYAPLIDSEKTLALLIPTMQQEIFDKNFIHEYFQINIAQSVAKLE